MNKSFAIKQSVKATQGQRFSNYIIDMIVLYMIIILLSVLLTVITLSMDSFAFSDWVDNMSGLEGYLVLGVILVLYYTILEAFTSRSLSKYITGTMVVMEDGSKPDLGTIIKRSFSRLIPFDHFSFLGGGSRGWHDSISNTYVVKAAAFKLEKKLSDELEEIGVEQTYQQSAASRF